MKIIRLVLTSIFWPFTLLLGGVLWVVGLVTVKIISRRRQVQEVLSWNKEYLVKGWVPKWAYLFGNLEDGVTGPRDPTHPSVRDWVRKTRYWPFPRKCVSWYIRNPVANERFSKLGVYLRRSKMEWVGNSENPWEEWKYHQEVNLGEAIFKNGLGYYDGGCIFFDNDRYEKESDNPRTALWFNITPRKAYWCWARQGWRSGLWVVTKKGTTYRIGAKVYPGYTREIDRWQGMVTIQRRRAHL